MLTNEDLQSIRFIMKAEIDTALKPIHQKFQKIDKQLKDIVHFFDYEITDARRRIDRLEYHVGLPHELP